MQILNANAGLFSKEYGGEEVSNLLKGKDNSKDMMQ